MADANKDSPKKLKKKTASDETQLLYLVTKYFKLAGVTLAVWLVGWTRFSPSWLLLGLVLYLWKERHVKQRHRRMKMMQQIAENEKEVILATVEDLPSWVHFPDRERAEWFNQLYQVSWPATVLFLCGYLYYSLAESDWGGYSEQSKTWRNVNIRLDFLIWFLHGILSFVFPQIQCKFQTTLAPLDNAHGFLARGLGASFLMLAVTAGRSVNFLREEDKKSILLSHGVANLLFLMTMAFCQMFTKDFSEWHLYYGMSFVALTAINDFLGCDVPNMATSAKFQIRNFFSKKED